MTIRKAVHGDLSRIMDIYHTAQAFMIRSGNPDQWAHVYPSEALIREDIDRGICHVACDGVAIHGVFALMSARSLPISITSSCGTKSRLSVNATLLTAGRVPPPSS